MNLIVGNSTIHTKALSANLNNGVASACTISDFKLLFEASTLGGAPRKLSDVSHFSTVGWDFNNALVNELAVTYQCVKASIDSASLA